MFCRRLLLLLLLQLLAFVTHTMLINTRRSDDRRAGERQALQLEMRRIP